PRTCTGRAVWSTGRWTSPGPPSTSPRPTRRPTVTDDLRRSDPLSLHFVGHREPGVAGGAVGPAEDLRQRLGDEAAVRTEGDEQAVLALGAVPLVLVVDASLQWGGEQ